MENKQLKSFKDLSVWQKSADLGVRVYSVTEKFPRSELYGITNQMRRAVISCSSNIAEGFKRAHKKEKLQFYNVAYGSIAELESQLEIAYKLKFLDKEDYEKILFLTVEISKILGGLIKSLNSKSYILDSNNNGQSLVEILVAMAIFVITSAAAIFLFFGGQSLSIDSANSQLALERASEGLEATRSIQNRDWSQLTDGQHGLVFSGGQWQFSGASDSKDIFTRAVFISSVDLNTKKASTTITWQTDPLRPQKMELAALLTNWKNPLSGGCGSDPLSGNWAAPMVLGSADIGAGNEGTDVAVKLPYVFVSAKASSGSKPDLLVFNVSNPASPSLVRQIDIGSSGINSLFLKDNYLYAASANDSRELAIFNIADPPNTSEAGFLNLSGSSDAISVLAIPNSNVVAIGRKDSASYEITFVDASNPALPSITNQTAVGGDINDFTYANRKLYAVSEDSDDDIWIFDVSDPLTPNLISTYNIRDGTEDISVGFQLPGNLLVGNEDNKFIILGATTTSQMYLRSSLATGGAVNDMVCVTGNLAFLATTNSTKEFIVVNIGNPDAPLEYGSLNFPQMGTGIDFADNKIFMSVRSNDALRIITSTAY